MTECNELGFELPGFSGRKIEGNFEGGNVSSDGGLVLLLQVDGWIVLTKAVAQRLPDERDADKIEHSLEGMLRQRIYGLALGHEISTITIFAQTFDLANDKRANGGTGQLLDPLPLRKSCWA
jgi:hypothetical protein